MGESYQMKFPIRDSFYVTSSEKTFANDELLPNLPVPSLKGTLEKYLISVKALVSSNEYERTQEIVNKFSEGIGKILQEKLMERAKHHRNWLEKWWEEIAYLQQRTPLIPLCSMSGFSNLGPMWPLISNTQIEHAALYLHFQFSFWKLLRKELLRPHYSHNTPWTMHQFKKYFSSVRVPGETCDVVRNYFQTELEAPIMPTHIIILHRGHIFTFDVVDEYGDIFTPPEISLQLTRIKDWCKANGQGACVGALTVDDRTRWAKNRQYLLNLDPKNELCMVTIDTSLAVLCLDDAEPKDLSEIIQHTLGGDCNNRWADKSVNDIAFNNGAFNILSDHSPYDGLVPIVAGHYIYMSLLECDGIWKGIQTVERDLLPPRHLEFKLDNHIICAIKDSQLQYQKMVDDSDICCCIFNQYGKSFLKPYRIHPETYIQFAIQYGYFIMYGRSASTYVTAATRQFYHGRTETMRGCFPEVMDWVYAMEDDKKTPKERYQLMIAASEVFKTLMKAATQNHGCDRHLLGLYMISVEDQLPVPDIFLDPSWIKSGGNGNFILSTSCSGYTPLGGCVMPMREDGYGTFYNIEDNRFTISISSFRRCKETDSQGFFVNIEKALLRMENLMTSSKL